MLRLRPLLALLLTSGIVSAQVEQKEALDHLLRTLPPSNPKITGRINAQDKAWEEWVKRTGELPPVWSKMPANAFLPDPFTDHQGRPVRTPEEWKQRRAWIRQQFEHWVFGTMPPAPGNLRAVVTGEQQEGELTVRDVRLEFGPGHKASLRVQLLIPPGSGPFPVFLTNHPRNRPWVATAVRRGYIGAIYYAADPIYGNADDSDAWIEVYPEAEWSTLARWAWAGIRTVDYLYTLSQVDTAKIAITGHSRNGKQALLAAAFDDRIGAIATSSGNTGEGTPWRYTGDNFANESLEAITRNFPHWFHPRLRFFSGREHQLPVDQNLLMALVAPRGLLLSSSYSEGQGGPFGFEQAYRSVRPIYAKAGAEKNLGLYLREGEHPTTAEDIEQFVDFFDHVFGRGGQRQETWILGFDWEKWSRRKQPPAPSRTAPLAERIHWALGTEPAAAPFPNSPELQKTVRTDDGPLAFLYGRPKRIAGAEHAPVAFGDDLKADLYYPAGSAPGKRHPLVVWLHGFSHNYGYSRQTEMFAPLIARGFAVLAFDQIGYGTRIHSAKRFYERYPQWSQMGKMAADTRAAIAAGAALPNVNPKQIYLAGQYLGSAVALYTAAQEPRVAGLALMGGITPLRDSKPDDGTEGVQQFAQLHGLIPRLGFYSGREPQLPLDSGDLLAAVAPRPVLLVAPQKDRFAPVDRVRRMAGETASVTLLTPDDFLRFPAGTQQQVIEWLSKKASE